MIQSEYFTADPQRARRKRRGSDKETSFMKNTLRFLGALCGSAVNDSHFKRQSWLYPLRIPELKGARFLLLDPDS